MRTILAMIAARAPAYVEFPGRECQHALTEAHDVRKDKTPLNRVLTVAKYEPIGTTIMANVNARSFRITELARVSGGAGAMSLGKRTLGLQG